MIKKAARAANSKADGKAIALHNNAKKQKPAQLAGPKGHFMRIVQLAVQTPVSGGSPILTSSSDHDIVMFCVPLPPVPQGISWFHHCPPLQSRSPLSAFQLSRKLDVDEEQ